MKKNIIFFIGTDAELIKIFPVIMECQSRGIRCHIIASGQNDIKKNRIMSLVDLNGYLIELSNEESIVKNAKGLLMWFVKTRKTAIKKIKEGFPDMNFKGTPLVVHGDTVSTFLGAWIGNCLGCLVCHVEAGLRSHHLLNPFPEEIDRILTSRIARLHFAPGKEPKNNLVRVKGEVVDTIYNTILDSLNYSQCVSIVTEGINEIIKQDYFVFVMHRQENLANIDFVKSVVSKINEIAIERKCVIILHKITENVLEDMKLLNDLKMNNNLILLPRVDYFDFMKLLQHSQFVITDGGSNQEELHYMGKPCLIMRKATERKEGLGTNALLFDGKIDNILKFAKEYAEYREESVINQYCPSVIIAEKLLEKCR